MKNILYNSADPIRTTLSANFLSWDLEYTHIKWGGPVSIQEVRNFIYPGSRILDAGCGSGRYLEKLAEYYTAVGVDISSTALQNSRVQLLRHDREAEHLKASVHLLPFKTETFAGIFCYGVFQHLFCKERTDTAKEFGRILEKGGLVFFEAFGQEDMRYGGTPAGLGEDNTFVRQNGIIYHYFTEKEVKMLFKDFETLKLESLKKEKIFKGIPYQRHMIHGIFRKAV